MKPSTRGLILIGLAVAAETVLTVTHTMTEEIMLLLAAVAILGGLMQFSD